MLKEKGGRGFPYCTIMNADGEVVWEVRPTSEDAVRDGLAHARKLVKLQAAAKQNPDDKALAASVELLEAVGRQQRQAPGMDELEELAQTEGLDKDVAKVFAKWSKDQKLAKAARRGGAYKLLKSGVAPDAGAPYALAFYMNAAREAVEKKDAAVAAKAWAGFEPEWNGFLKKNPDFAENPRAKRTIDMIKDLEEQVKALQKEGDGK